MTGFGGIQPGFDHSPHLEAGELALPVDRAQLWCSKCGSALMYLTAADEWIHIPLREADPWDTSGEVHAVALVISNAYRARHGMPPLEIHATVDEDIARALLASGWLREWDAQVWEEGVMAQYNSSSIFVTDTLSKNPYRKADQ